MGITTSTGLTSFDKSFYQGMAAVASTYITEKAKSRFIPVAVVQPVLADEYKKPIFDASQGVRGEQSLGVNGEKLQTPKQTKTHGLSIVRGDTYYGPNELKENGKYVVQKKDSELNEWMRVGDLSVFSGVHVGGYTQAGLAIGTQLCDGLLDNAGAVIDLDGVDSTLAAQGDVYKALVKMITSIPFRYRENFEVHLAMTPHFFEKATSILYTYDNGMTEWEAFFDKFITKGVDGFKVSRNVIVSEAVFGNLGDTLNTHDRLMAYIPIPRVMERAFSLGVKQLGQKKDEINGVVEAWGMKLGGCVHDVNAVLLSEQIVWP